MIFSRPCGIIFHGKRKDFSEVRAQTDKLKAIISAEQTQRDEIVGLAMERTPLMLETVAAFLELGVPFLPLDISLPEKRLGYMLEKAEVKRIVTTSDIAQKFSGMCRVIPADTAQADGIALRESSELAYVLFTSGSTGEPKAVMVKRAGLENFIGSVPQIIVGFDESSVIACFTQYTFDIFFLESALAMHSGMTVVLADESEMANPAHISSLIRTHGITMLQMTPSRLRLLQLHDRDFACLAGVRTLMVGGERFPEELLAQLNRIGGLCIYNMYGPTETTIWSTIGELTGKTEVDIGKPIAHTQIYILNESLNELADGQTGEICIAGDALAAGYINNPQQTAKSFCTDALDRKIYRTGDLGYRENGLLYCLGRVDNQIKLYGHRIELEDVEQNIITEAGLKIAAVAFDGEKNRLVCFYAQDISPEKIRECAQSVLPDYMVPAEFVRVEELAYTSSGKADRKAMLAAYRQRGVQPENAGEEDNGIMSQVISILREKKLVQGSVDTSVQLQDLGISSLDFIDLVVSFEDKFGIEFEDEYLSVEMFESLEQLAGYIGSLAEEV